MTENSNPNRVLVASFGNGDDVSGYDIIFPNGPTISVSPEQAEHIREGLGVLLGSQFPSTGKGGAV